MSVGVPWSTIGAFLRIATHPTFPGQRYRPDEAAARGALVPDAELAALTVEHGGVLHTTDRGFARFPSLRWRNPLA